jgi:hypothetical protein
MATQVRLRRGTTTDHQSFTGQEGEITVDTDKDTLVVHDGTTAGGIPLLKSSLPRGWTKREHFTANGTWTKSGKTDLKRIIVTTYGGGGGGDGSNWAGAGGQGGVGYVDLDVSSLTTNVSVTIGSGGAAAAAGGVTSFGTYITSNGGAQGNNNGAYLGQGGKAGNVTGNASGLVDLGGHPGEGGMGYSATANSNFGNSNASAGGGPGAGSGNSTSATGCLGGGGAAAGSGADGSVIIEEIYGEY